MKKEIAKLQAEMIISKAKHSSVKEINTVKDDFPVLTRKYAYRDSTKL